MNRNQTPLIAFHPSFSSFRSARLHVVLIFLALSVWAFTAPGPSQAEEQVVRIRIVNRNVEEILPLVRPLVSPAGFISADARSNSLIVIDETPSIRRIESLVQELDQPVPQLKIVVRFENQADAERLSAEANARVEAGKTNVTIGSREEEGADVQLDAGQNRTQRASEATIIVRSGSSAYIASGYDLPYPERWRDLAHRTGHAPTTTVFRSVETGYDVRPVLMGKMVQIDITPRLGYQDDRARRHQIRFAEATTQIMAPLGQWVVFGASANQRSELNARIMSAGRYSTAENLTMRLKVTLD